MPKLSPISSRDLVKIIEKLDFVKARQAGSHARFIHADGRRITIPLHAGENIHRGILRKIIRDLNFSLYEFNKIRRK